jgi:hypothetical protein
VAESSPGDGDQRVARWLNKATKSLGNPVNCEKPSLSSRHILDQIYRLRDGVTPFQVITSRV